jgi:hypothetical protein
MMMIRRRLFLLIAVTALCLWLGFKSAGSAEGRTEQNSPIQPHPGASASGSSPLELKVLFVEVDSLGDPARAHLKSAWLVVNHPAETGVYWFPLVPSGSLEASKNPLVQGFHMQENLLPNEEFFNLLRKVYQIEWDSLIVLDKNDIKQVIAYFDGGRDDSRWMNENHDFILDLDHDVQIDLKSYARFIRSVCTRRDELALHPLDTTVLVQYLSEKMKPASMTEPAAFNQMVNQFKERFLNTQPLPCEFVGVK